MTKVDHENRFDAAVAMTREGRHGEAVAALEELIDLAGDDPRVRAAAHAYLGGLHLYERGDPVRAEPHFLAALALHPKAERASLGLFHSLVGQGRIEEALEEARRFLALRPSEEYSTLLTEMLDGVDDGERDTD